MLFIVSIFLSYVLLSNGQSYIMNDDLSQCSNNDKIKFGSLISSETTNGFSTWVFTIKLNDNGIWNGETVETIRMFSVSSETVVLTITNVDTMSGVYRIRTDSSIGSKYYFIGYNRNDKPIVKSDRIDLSSETNKLLGIILGSVFGGIALIIIIIIAICCCIKRKRKQQLQIINGNFNNQQQTIQSTNNV